LLGPTGAIQYQNLKIDRDLIAFDQF
jgi:hypothetical protein